MNPKKIVELWVEAFNRGDAVVGGILAETKMMGL